MCTYKHICITNRKLVAGDLIQQLDKVLTKTKVKDENALSRPGMVILREKDLSEIAYEELARQVIALCKTHDVLCVLHSFDSVTKKLNHPHVHVTFAQFEELVSRTEKEEGDGKMAPTLSWFKTIGVSTHSVEEAYFCAEHGATYVTASHIFETECKPGLEARGLEYLAETVKAVSAINQMQVYALGGIHPSNERLCIDAGADGVCMMSEYMWC